MIGDGEPPEALSKPFLLKLIFIETQSPCRKRCGEHRDEAVTGVLLAVWILNEVLSSLEKCNHLDVGCLSTTNTNRFI
jgi:hypothetical protein